MPKDYAAVPKPPETPNIRYWGLTTATPEGRTSKTHARHDGKHASRYEAQA